MGFKPVCIFMVLLVLGAGPKWLDFSNNFTNYMRKCCFGIYVLHIPVLLVINYLLAGKELPLTVVYGIDWWVDLWFQSYYMK